MNKKPLQVKGRGRTGVVAVGGKRSYLWVIVRRVIVQTIIHQPKKAKTMAKAKENFGKILENQQQLLDTITNQVGKVSELFSPDQEVAETGQQLFSEYVAKSKELMEKQMEPKEADKFWENLPDQYAKAVEFQMDYFNKTVEFYKTAFDKFNVKTQQDNWKKLTEVYQKSYDAMVETTNANLKIMQEFFN